MNDVIDSVKKTVKYWWLSLLIGLLGIVVGVWCLFTPASSLFAITALFIIVLLMVGIFDIVFAVSNRRYSNSWGWHLAGGILELLLGVLLLCLPLPASTGILIYLVGFWMLFRSVMGIAESCELQMVGFRGWGWLLALSILSLLFSFIYLLSPIFGGIFIVIYIGISFILYGIYRIVLAIRQRKINKELNDIVL